MGFPKLDERRLDLVVFLAPANSPKTIRADFSFVIGAAFATGFPTKVVTSILSQKAALVDLVVEPTPGDRGEA